MKEKPRTGILVCLLIASCGDDASTRDASVDAAHADGEAIVDARPDAGDATAPETDGGPRCSDPAPSPVPCLGDGCEVLLVASGDRHACFVVREGFVYCWGANEEGQLGDGTTCDRSTPVRVPRVEGVIDLSAGRARTCARLRDGTAECWGSGSLEARAIDATEVSAVGVGDDHLCVITGGRVRCAGASERGELGVVLAAPSDALVDVALPAMARRIAVGAHHACTRLSEDVPAVACWGDDRSGQRGSGSVHADPIADVATPMLAAPNAIATGRAHSCALLPGGELRCWGDATSGAIGLPALALVPEPRIVPLDLPASVVGLTAHGDLTCLLLGGGAIACMGDGSRGQLGATERPRGEAAVVSGVESATQVAPGSDHVCALVGSGEVICWGANDRGQLGRGTTSSMEPPGAVVGLPQNEP